MTFPALSPSKIGTKDVPIHVDVASVAGEEDPGAFVDGVAGPQAPPLVTDLNVEKSQVPANKPSDGATGH